MDERDLLAEHFEAHRAHLREVAYRMLGSLAEAEDAVQEAWLRLSRSDPAGIDNLAGWLRTVVSRICLDALRSRASRREDPAGERLPDPPAPDDPAREAQLADSVGRALLIVMDALAPAERIAFVLHDVFGIPFAEIAPVLTRSPEATKKLAGRARRKVRAGADVPHADLARHRRVVGTFLAAVRTGDLDAIMALLAPDVVRRADPVTLPPGEPTELRGAQKVAREIRILSQGHAGHAEPALVNGLPGAVVAPHGRLALALTFTIEDERITAYEVIADPARLRALTVSVLDE